MSELENTKSVGRRTVLKGAAWSVPVVAAAAAMPLAAASGGNLSISSGCVQVAGVNLLPGFRVTNSDVDAVPGPVTITETIDLTALNGPLGGVVRAAFWAALTVTGLIQGSSAGVSVGSWVFSPTGVLVIPTKAVRTVTIAGGIAAGASKGWGQVVSLAGVGDLTGGTWSASITQPSGNPPVNPAAKTASLDFQILGGC